MSRKKLWPTPDSFSALANPPMGKEETGKNRHALKLGHAVQMGDTDGDPTSQLPLLPEASLASLLVSPGSDEARKMTAGSGLKCLESLRRSDRDGLLRRTLLGSSIWGSTIVYLTWRIAATLSNRILFQLVPLTPRTGGPESSLLHTPTETANQLSPSMVEREAGSWGLWPTPMPADVDGGRTTKGKGRQDEGGLRQAVKLWPTPTGRDHKDTGDLENVEDNGLLGRVVRPSKESGSLSPQWVEWLQGFPPGWTDLEPSETP